MSLQDSITSLLNEARTRELESIQVLRLGQIIEKLEALVDRCGDASVYFDFSYTHPVRKTTIHFSPMDLMSWRGVYAELCLGYEDADGDGMLVSELLADFKLAVGKSFQGYKGDDYVMDLDTPVWVDNYGDASSRAIVDVTTSLVSDTVSGEKSTEIILRTRDLDG